MPCRHSTAMELLKPKQVQRSIRSVSAAAIWAASSFSANNGAKRAGKAVVEPRNALVIERRRSLTSTCPPASGAIDMFKVGKDTSSGLVLIVRCHCISRPKAPCHTGTAASTSVCHMASAMHLHEASSSQMLYSITFNVNSSRSLP